MPVIGLDICEISGNLSKTNQWPLAKKVLTIIIQKVLPSADIYILVVCDISVPQYIMLVIHRCVSSVKSSVCGVERWNEDEWSNSPAFIHKFNNPEIIYLIFFNHLIVTSTNHSVLELLVSKSLNKTRHITTKLNPLCKHAIKPYAIVS